MATSRIADSVGRVLGDRYRLIRPLGVGASAHVYVADDVNLRRRVAIKVLHPALAGDEAFLRRFRAEAQVVASLRHPNILTVYDWGEDGGSPYLVMELLEGGSLRALLDRGMLLSPGQAASVGGDAARALDYAHRRGLVHRDIKPANLIFDDEGRARVADFGLARALAEATWTEPAGAVVGTARYAAPEQVRGATLDSRADVYSLAVLLVEATTGVVPFAADTTLGTLMARLEHPLTVPPAAGPLQPVLEAAGTIDPADRLDAAGLVRGLERVAAKLPPPAPLSLTSPINTGTVEADHASPTEYPGRPRLFDVAAVEAEEAAAEHVSNGHSGPPARPAAASAGSAAASLTAGTSNGGLDLRDDRDAVLPPDGRSAGPDSDDDVPSPPGPPKRRWRLRMALIVVAVLVILGGGAGAYTVESGVLLPSHPVPNLFGQTDAQALAALLPIHLKLVVSSSVYSPNMKDGLILEQTPRTGVKLREHQTVRVVLSKGPAPVGVPSLIDQPEGYVTGALGTIGLVPKFVPESSDTTKAGDVISTSPSAGVLLLPKQTVTVVISTGKPQSKVPTLFGTSSGASFAAARAALAAVKLGATEDDVYSTTVAKGLVVETTPAAGTSEIQGTTITVEISKGPHYVPVPNVQGDSVGAATDTLTADGFDVTGVSGNPLGTVTGTDPAAGDSVVIGASVTILTG